MQPDQANRLVEIIDREELFDLVRRERFARDQRRFDVMRACFHEDARVRTSWYDGVGGQAYVDATIKMMGPPGIGGKHWVFPAFAKINGDRATVESPAVIFGRAMVDGVEVEFHAYARFFSRCVRQDGAWKIFSFEVLWEYDEMKAARPGEKLPFDYAAIVAMRPSYRHMAYLQTTRGFKVNQNLLGDDRPDELSAFHEGEDAWLAGND
jgi:hypothetical protein